MTTLLTRAARAATGRGGVLGHERGFWVIASAFLVGMAFSTIPTPLYPLYEQRDGFASATVTVVFAAYAIGVAISLFLAGHVSDWLGRRRVLVPALVVEALAAVLFLVWPALPGLIVARVLTGIGVGMITATATAHLSELHAASRPGVGRTRAELVSTAANLGGLGLGPLVSGLLAQFVTGPLTTPYLVFLVLLLLAAGGVALVPETVEPAVERPAYRPQRINVPDDARRRFVAAALGAVAVFAVFGLFTSLAPVFVAGTMHVTSRIVAGVVGCVAFGAAALAQMALGRISTRTQLATGIATMAVGLVPVTVSLFLPSLPLFLAGGVVAGAGAGLLFKGAVSTVAGLAAPGARGEALAGLFLAAYLGLAVPVVALGVVTQFVPAADAVLGFAVLVLLVIAAAATGLVGRAGRG